MDIYSDLFKIKKKNIKKECKDFDYDDHCKDGGIKNGRNKT